jgi:hypothetical protein
VSALLTLTGLGLALAFRRGRIALWPVLLVVVAAALATGLTARMGGQMAFGEVEPESAP